MEDVIITVNCWQWPYYTPIHGGFAEGAEDAVQVTALNPGDGVSFQMSVTANEKQELNVDVQRIAMSKGATVQVLEQENGRWVSLAEASLDKPDNISLIFTPTQGNVQIQVTGPVQTLITKLCLYAYQEVEKDELVTLCSEDKDKYRWGYNGKEKVNEWAGVGNYLDYGARGLDTRVGRWLARDPLAIKYAFSSPYAFSLNSPVWAKDPDGKVVVFINGNYYNGSGGTARYWRSIKTYVVGKRSERDLFGHWSDETLTMDREYDFDKAIMNDLGDHKKPIYRDGSLGGNALPGKKNMSAETRRQAGYKRGVLDAKNIISNLQRDKAGKITETIKVVTHSMGAAYAKGWDNGILDYADKHGIKGVKIEYEIDFAPFQPTSEANNAVERHGMGPTYQFSHSDDHIAGDSKEKDAIKMKTDKDSYPSGLWNLVSPHKIGNFENSEHQVKNITQH